MITNLKQLYEIDDAQWLDETVKLIKNQNLEYQGESNLENPPLLFNLKHQLTLELEL
ncbi:hypothetical protein [Planktothrix mougeotii]|uniref:Uncharacterized protein n=1 Tax=Planktothrix mougeotii LEGE 06226 TaxID=1828728 RepID=A0ABR9UHI5_9CYAN|nr:hypothetical protein [Planktothrix mougeotii]MBE9145926.1 hypothetical protein [Planktothrix mougeotii LEGE 06226]